MSEHQSVVFRAVDRPLTDKQLQFMERQSTQDEFTKWGFEAKYHYSSFRGDVDAMLRNGFDLYLVFGNYGQREVRLRLPEGLPFTKSVWSKYVDREGIEWKPDRQGKGGILTVRPFIDGVDGYVDDNDFKEEIEALVRLRDMLIVGDLRALFVLWLCTAMDDNADLDEMEPPLPHGLGVTSQPATELLWFFEVDPLIVKAAAAGVPKACPSADQAQHTKAWLKSLAADRRVEIIERLIAEDPTILKAELVSEIRSSQTVGPWPCEPPSRTVAELLKHCEMLAEKEEAKESKRALAKAAREAAKAEKAKQARMVEMKASPELWLTKVSGLVEQRGNENYHTAASLLAEVRDALGANGAGMIARKHAAHLVKRNPTLRVLKSSLRKHGLVD